MAPFEIRGTCTPTAFQEFMKSLGPQTLHNFDHFYWDDTYKTFYVDDGEKIIAYGFLRQATHRFKKHLNVLGMVVTDSYQGQGVGTFLGQKMIEWARKMSCNKIALGVYSDNTRAGVFYNKLGFVTEGILRREELRNGRYRDIVTMALYL